MSIEFNKDVSGIKPGSNDEKKIIIVKPQADPAQIGKLLGQKTGKLVKEVSQEELLKHLQELIERQTQQAPEYKPTTEEILSYMMSPEEWKKLQEKIEEWRTSWARKQQLFK